MSVTFGKLHSAESSSNAVTEFGARYLSMQKLSPVCRKLYDVPDLLQVSARSGGTSPVGNDQLVGSSFRVSDWNGLQASDDLEFCEAADSRFRDRDAASTKKKHLRWLKIADLIFKRRAQIAASPTLSEAAFRAHVFVFMLMTA